jgi:hypothetical protein
MCWRDIAFTSNKETDMKNLNQLLGGVALCMGSAMVAVHAQPMTTVPSSDDIESHYKAAKERCEAMSGNPREVCLKQADADRTAAKADAKAGKKTSQANHDAQQSKRDADYMVARQKCDSLSGDAKDKCQADVKTRFGK